MKEKAEPSREGAVTIHHWGGVYLFVKISIGASRELRLAVDNRILFIEKQDFLLLFMP